MGLQKLLCQGASHIGWGAQNMVEARNANYANILRHLCFGKRGTANTALEAVEVRAQTAPQCELSSAF